MNLTTLKQQLSKINNTDIEQVVFDFTSIMNKEVGKSYPYVFWNLGEADIQESVVKPSSITVPCIGNALFDYTTEDRVTKWEELKAQLLTYFNELNTMQGSEVNIDTRSMKLQVYEAGMLNVDQEIAVKYTVKIDVWC